MSAAKQQERPVVMHDQSELKGELKHVGGSMSDDWNDVLGNQALRSIWRSSDAQYRQEQERAVVAAMIGIAPGDEIEGMLAAQLVACHNVSMECFRRAMIGEQTFEGRRENLNQANKLSRTYAVLLEALNRHRGKGQQKVTVEHVHVHSGGQAIVGAVTGGTGVSSKTEEQPHARQIAHAPELPMRRSDTARDPVPSGRDEQRPLPNARRLRDGSAEGK